MRRRGFTVLELVIVLSISAVLVPLVYLFVRNLGAVTDQAAFQLEVATQARGLSDELDGDRQRPECAAKYRLDPDGTVHRAASEACGGDRVLATHVTRFERTGEGVEVQFARALSVERSVRVDFFLAGVVP